MRSDTPARPTDPHRDTTRHGLGGMLKEMKRCRSSKSVRSTLSVAVLAGAVGGSNILQDAGIGAAGMSEEQLGRVTGGSRCQSRKLERE